MYRNHPDSLGWGEHLNITGNNPRENRHITGQSLHLSISGNNPRENRHVTGQSLAFQDQEKAHNVKNYSLRGKK